jgi:hypothetical protein
MNNPAYLIDGHMEKKVIQQVCPGSVVRILQCNGKNASLQAIADRVATHCRLFHGKYYPLIVIIDREDRRQSVKDIVRDLLSLIKNNGINDKLIVAVADRSIENWILGDIGSIKKSYPEIDLPSISSSDGFNGKALLKKFIQHYHETTIGVELLAKCRPSIMRRSPSFDFFFKQTKQLKCQWLGR